jgi:transposase
MKEFLVVAVDVSKKTLDFCFKPLGSTMRIDNNLEGFKLWHRQLKEFMSPVTKVMILMEHTGGYSFKFEKYLSRKNIDYCKIPALQIKRSLGVIRGKNDKIDAQRIAEYGWLRKEQLKADQPCSESMERLKFLLNSRDNLVKNRSGLICRLKEIKSTTSLSSGDFLIQSHNRIIKCLSAEIKVYEQKILKEINSDTQLKKTYELIRTVKGVGLIVAAFIIAKTNNFTRFRDARKFNCYAGLAPFKYESGSSIKGKSRVSHLADKTIKTLLNLAAWCAIRYDEELKQYYQKRVSEGMKKMSCINIIRSKMVSRIFAVAKRQTPYINLTVAA